MTDLPAATGGEAVLTEAQVKAGLQALEADSGVTDEEKALLRPIYQEAIDSLKRAEANQAREAIYRDAVQSGPAQAEELQVRLAALPAVETVARVSPPDEAEALQEESDRQRAVLAAKKEELQKATNELARVKARPVEISASLPDAHRELSGLEAQLASPDFADEATSPDEVADRLLLRAKVVEVRSVLQMLKQEQLGQSAREALFQAKIDLVTREVENAEAVDKALRSLLRASLAREVKKVASEAETMPEEIEGGDDAARDLAIEAQALAKEFETVVGQLNEAISNRGRITERVDLLVNSYDLLREQLKRSGGGIAMAQVLFNMERRLPSRHGLMVDLRNQQAALDAAYLAMIRIDENLGEQAELEKRFEGHPSEALVRIVSARSEVLGKLRTQYGRLIRELAGLVGVEQRYVDEISEVRGFLSEELFWMRSSPPLGLDTLTETPSGLKWLFSAGHRAELGGAIVSAFRHQLVASTVILLTAFLILFRRRAILAVIGKTGEETRRIATDRFGLTIKALLWSVVIILPVPMLLGYLGWALGQQAEPSSWLQGLARGLRVLTWIVFVLGFVATICHKRGLGVGHFRWPQRPLIQLRRAIMWFLLIYVPSALLVSSCLYGEASRYLDSAGRLSFMLSQIWLAVIYWLFLRFPQGVAPGVGEGSARVLVRWRHVYFALAVVCPVSLAVLLWFGYLFTAIELNQILVATMAVVVGGALSYWLMLRWFSVRVRRFALADALERRRERRERREAAAQEEGAGEPEEANEGEAEMEKLDLVKIGEQTRHMLRIICLTGILLGVVLLWSEIFPVFVIIDSVRLIGNLTLFDLAQAVLIIVITSVAVRSIPGLVRLVMLRTTKMASGTLTALTSLCQYAVVAICFAWVFGVLDLGWAKFGWIATALSVGLGFGLQEVVANFVCGLVLLFERPIRVGDFVTVEGMTGRVTNIRMRATTIVNWDRQEFVVPNKNFVTGTLLNWTLHDTTTRIVVTVGVAYGSDTDKAQKILLDIATAHPTVLDEPEPAATFEEFADSSLTLRLKAHIASVDKRIETLSELHTAIKKRFEAEEIEIAFPQRDLHIRTAGDLGRAVDSPMPSSGK